MPTLIPAQVTAGTAGRSTTGSAAVKLPSLTGMRWLAAFLVFGFHVGTLNLIRTTSYHHKWDMIFGLGGSGVSFFFVLSGFVLLWSARSSDTILRFWRRRIAKIYPNHIVMWALVIGVAVFYWGDQVQAHVAVANLFLLQPWFFSGPIPYSINSVSWSLGCEAFFYLCFPLVLPLVKKLPVWALYAAAALFWAGVHQAVLFSGHISAPARYQFTSIFPPVRSLEFWLGVVVGELVVRRRWRGPGLWGSTAIAFVVYAATRGVEWFPVGMPRNWWGANLALAFVVLIAGAAQADISGAWSPWRNRWLVWLGEVSFAFYMVHVIYMQTFLRVLERHVGWRGPQAAIVILFFLATSLFLAWLLYRFVEIPMMRLLGPKRRRLAPAPVADEVVPGPKETVPTAASRP